VGGKCSLSDGFASTVSLMKRVGRKAAHVNRGCRPPRHPLRRGTVPLESTSAWDPDPSRRGAQGIR